MGFIKEFLKQDGSQVYTPYASMLIAFCLATPIVCLSCVVIVYDVFWLRRGISAPMVSLLQALLGAATGGIVGAGATMFSRTFSQTFSSISSSVGPAPGAPPAAPAPGGARAPKPDGPD